MLELTQLLSRNLVLLAWCNVPGSVHASAGGPQISNARAQALQFGHAQTLILGGPHPS